MHAKRTTLVTGIAILLSACGGGDGGSDGSTTPASQLSYQGRTTPAVVTLDNMAEVSQVLSLLSQNQSYFTDSIVVSAQSAVSKQVNVDEDFGCAFGIGKISGNVDPSTYTGTVTANFEACDIDGSGQVILDGSYTVNAEAVDPNTLALLDSTVSFNGFKTSSYDGNYVSVTGQLIERGANTCQYSITQNLVSNSNQPNLNRYLKDVKTTQTCVSDDSLGYNVAKYSLSGRYYIAELGYIDLRSEDVYIANQVVFPQRGIGLVDVLAKGTLELYNESSSLQYIGSVEAVGDTINQYNYRTRVKLNELANNTQVIDVDMPSWMTVTPELLDFNDSDGDKMWDGYERYYGLDPFADDANEDLDYDGYSNLTEQLAETDPNSSFSKPIGYIGVSHTPAYVRGDVGMSLKIDVSITGGFDSRYAEVVDTFSIVADLPENVGEWQLKSDLGCVITNSNQVQCGNLLAQDFLIDTEGNSTEKPLLELTLIGDKAALSCVNFQVLAKTALDSVPSDACYSFY